MGVEAAIALTTTLTRFRTNDSIYLRYRDAWKTRIQRGNPQAKMGVKEKTNWLAHSISNGGGGSHLTMGRINTIISIQRKVLVKGTSSSASTVNSVEIQCRGESFPTNPAMSCANLNTVHT